MRPLTFLFGLLGLALAAPALAQDNQILYGAGATFPFPLYQRWIEEYEKVSRTRIEYDSVGSGEGITRIQNRQVDFGATDAFLDDEEVNKGGRSLLHVPTCIGAVVITYNLPGNPSLRFTPELIAGIFLGEISDWSDARIAKYNPGNVLPAIPIRLVHRSDGSGTTFVFTNYLSKISKTWNARIGMGKRVDWPSGLGAEGNHGVAEFVKKIPGAVGYIESTYASVQKLPMALVRNRSGNFVEPSLEAMSAAAKGELPADMRVLITDTSAPEGYPISAFTYLLLDKNPNFSRMSMAKAQALVDFVWWILHDGQQFNTAMQYAPLPPDVIARAEAIVLSMTYSSLPIRPKTP